MQGGGGWALWVQGVCLLSKRGTPQYPTLAVSPGLLAFLLLLVVGGWGTGRLPDASVVPEKHFFYKKKLKSKLFFFFLRKKLTGLSKLILSTHFKS